MEAAGGGNKDIVSAIRLSKANIEAVDDHGNTALHYAAYYGHLVVVQELLKGNPNKEVKNNQGHTAASYAVSNRHKGVADLINRFRPRKEADTKGTKQKEAPQKEPPQKKEAMQKPALQKDKDDDLPSPPPKAKKTSRTDEEDEEEIVDLDAKEEPPKSEPAQAPEEPQKTVNSVTSPGFAANEKKALEDQLAKMKRQHEEAELRAQRKIVELMENNAKQQQSLDDAEREVRTAKLNHTDLTFRVQELESKHQGSELRMLDEKQRADRLEEELQKMRKERDMHAEAAKRHESSPNLAQEEVIRQHQRELAELREELARYRASGDTSKPASSDTTSQPLAATPPATPPSPTPAPPLIQPSKVSETSEDVALSTKDSTKPDSQGGKNGDEDDNASDNVKGRPVTEPGPTVEVKAEA